MKKDGENNLLNLVIFLHISASPSTGTLVVLVQSMVLWRFWRVRLHNRLELVIRSQKAQRLKNLPIFSKLIFAASEIKSLVKSILEN